MSNTRVETHQEPVRVRETRVVVREGRQRHTDTWRDFASSLGEAVRDQPASAALITMGVAWLFMGGDKVSLFGRTEDRQNVQVYRFAEAAPGYPTGGRLAQGSASQYALDAGEARPHAGWAAEQGKQAGSAIGHGASAAGSAVGEGASAVDSALRHGGSAAASGVSEASSRVYEGFETTTRAASDAVSSAGTAAYHASRSASVAARREAEQLQQSLSEFFERQPWALAVLGLAVGAGVAAALPKTRAESEWMGEASNAVKDQAQTLVSEQLANARRLANRAMEETAREARAQGLSEEKVADAIRAFSEKLTSVVSTAGDSLNSEIGKTTGPRAKS